MNLSRTFLLIVGTAIFGQVSAQSISGKIKDNNSGETLIGVNVFNQDKNGVTTDLDGNYKLDLSAGEHTINFSFIGYQSIKRKVTLMEGETVSVSPKMFREAKELDVVVVTGSQFEKKVSQEMVTIDVVKDYILTNTASPDARDALNKVPGVIMLDGQASIRGGSGYSYGVGSRVQLVIDDVPLLTGDLKDIQWSAIPMETMEQMEVVKGASSSLYGSGAMNGVVHVRTGWAKDKPETTFRIFQGLYTNPRVEEARWWDNTFTPIFTGVFFSHRHKIKNFDLVVGAHASSGNTYLQNGHRQAVRANVKTRVRNQKVKGLSYGINGNLQYQQSGRFILWEDNSAGAYKPLSGTSSTDKYLFSNVDPWIQYANPDYGTNTLRVRHYRVERRSDEWEDPAVSNVLYADYRYQKRFKYDFDLVVGGQYSYVWSQSNLYDLKAYTHNPAVFGQLEKRFWDRWSVLAGVRYEWNTVLGVGAEESGPMVRAGMNFTAAKKTNIRASFGQAFRFPSIGERHISTTLGSIFAILPNEELRPERGWSAELGVKQGFRINNWNAYADFALFWMESTDVIEYKLGTYDGDIGFKPFNISRARIAGAEIGLTGNGNLGPIPLRVYLGYTFTYPADLETDTAQQNVNVFIQNLFHSISNSDSLDPNSILKYRIANVFKGDVEFDLWKFTIGMNVEYTSFMDRIDAEFESLLPGFSEYRELNDKGVWRFDARVYFNISPKSSVGLVAKNISNEFYSVRPGVMEAPRSFALQYKLKI
jgi:iron complex outermembrane receptor protein